eukprot:13080-Heterococcus_DN1.PRE.3
MLSHTADAPKSTAAGSDCGMCTVKHSAQVTSLLLMCQFTLCIGVPESDQFINKHDHRDRAAVAGLEGLQTAASDFSRAVHGNRCGVRCCHAIAAGNTMCTVVLALIGLRACLHTAHVTILSATRCTELAFEDSSVYVQLTASAGLAVQAAI